MLVVLHDFTLSPSFCLSHSLPLFFSLYLSFSLSARFAFSPFALWPALAVARPDNRKKRESPIARCAWRYASALSNSKFKCDRIEIYSNSRRTCYAYRALAWSPPVRAVVAGVFARILKRELVLPLFIFYFFPKCIISIGCEYGPRKKSRAAQPANDDENLSEKDNTRASSGWKTAGQIPSSDERRGTLEDRWKERGEEATRNPSCPSRVRFGERM